MTTLRLAIDASGMRTGAQDAVRALEGVKRTAQETGRSVQEAFEFTFSRGNRIFVPDRLFDPVEKSAQRAGAAASGMGQQFGVAIESLSIGNRVRALTGEFEALSAGMGSASTATLLIGQSLLDVSQIMVRMRQTAGPSGFFAGLFGRITANPILAIVTAIGAASAAMAIFGGNTEKAADAMKDLIAQQGELDARSRLAGRIGDFDYRDPRGTSKSAIDLIGSVKPDTRLSAAEAARLLGVSQDAFRLQVGTYNALERRPITQQDVFGREAARAFAGQTTYAQTEFGSEDIIRAAERIARERLATERGESLRDRGLYPSVEAPPRGEPQPYGPTEGEAQTQATRLQALEQEAQVRQQAQASLTEYITSLRQETELLGMSEDQRAQAAAVMQAENIARQGLLELSEAEKASIREQIRLQQQLIETRQLMTEIGAAGATAFFSWVNGANSARQALAALFQQLVQIAQARAIAGFSTAVGGVFGRTAAQGAQDGAGSAAGMAGAGASGLRDY